MYQQLLDQYDEADLQALAFDFGMMFEEIEGESYSGKALALYSYILYSGQWDLFRARLEAERPSVQWIDYVSHPLLLPLRPEEIKDLPQELQLTALLEHHFSRREIGIIANELDQTIDWQQPPYSCAQSQLSAVVVSYLVGHQKVLQLLSVIKQKRPHIAAIQQFTWEESSDAFAAKSLDELFVEAKAVPFSKLPRTSFPLLQEQLGQHFTQLDLEEVCLDAGTDFEMIDDRTTLEEAVNSTLVKLERLTPEQPISKAFIAACMNKAPTVDWAEVVGLKKADIPPIESVVSGGFYLSRIRALTGQSLLDNRAIFDFVQKHFPPLRGNMSQDWLPRKNTLALISSVKRRGRLSDLLTILKTEYPQQYELFAPYTPSE